MILSHKEALMADTALRRLTSNYYKTAAARRHSVTIQLCVLPNGKCQVLVKMWSTSDDHTLLVRM